MTLLTFIAPLAAIWLIGGGLENAWDCPAVGKKLYKGMEAPHSSLAAASVTMKINNVTRFFLPVFLKSISWCIYRPAS